TRTRSSRTSACTGTRKAAARLRTTWRPQAPRSSRSRRSRPTAPRRWTARPPALEEAAAAAADLRSGRGRLGPEAWAGPAPRSRSPQEPEPAGSALAFELATAFEIAVAPAFAPGAALALAEAAEEKSLVLAPPPLP